MVLLAHMCLLSFQGFTYFDSHVITSLELQHNVELANF